MQSSSASGSQKNPGSHSSVLSFLPSLGWNRSRKDDRPDHNDNRSVSPRAERSSSRFFQPFRAGWMVDLTQSVCLICARVGHDIKSCNSRKFPDGSPVITAFIGKCFVFVSSNKLICIDFNVSGRGDDCCRHRQGALHECLFCGSADHHMLKFSCKKNAPDLPISTPPPPPNPSFSYSHPDILYKFCTPYNPNAFEQFLIDFLSLHKCFDGLPLKLRKGFNMGDFPAMTKTTIFPNSPSVEDHRDFLDEYFAEEVREERMSGLFSKEEMEGICGGFFQSSPLSTMLSLDEDGNVKKRLCCNYSKEGSNSPSANSFIDLLKFPTKFDTLAKMAEIVSPSSLSPSHSAWLSVLEVLRTCATSYSRLFALARPWVFCTCETLISFIWLFTLAWPLFLAFTLAQPLPMGLCYPYMSLYSPRIMFWVLSLSHIHVLSLIRYLCFLVTDYQQITHTPPGTQAMTLNVSKFHRRTPIAPAHKPWFIMQNRLGEFYMTHTALFGASGSESNSEEPRDFAVKVWTLLDVDLIVNWSDDLNIFRFPIDGDRSSESPFIYCYNSKQILHLVASLGILWHPLEKKGQDFSFTTTYTGFNWDIPKCLVSLPEKKCVKFLNRVSDFKSSAQCSGVTVEECMKIQGTLVHILFVAPLGHLYIPALSRFITIFNMQSRNEFTCWHLHRAVLPELDYWIDFLSYSTSPRELRKRGDPQDIGISVDASTDWGVGLCWGRRWVGWRAVNWSGAYRNIGWLEGVAVEFMVYVLVENGFHDCCILVCSNNKGVIAAFWRGCSRNVEVNLSI